MQYFIATANWDMTASTTENTVSFPIRWYVYGSGPRLFWQWATGAVPSGLVLTLSFDVFLRLWYRIGPGPWLTLDGMLNAANAVDKMGYVYKGCAGVAAEDSKRLKYGVRDLETCKWKIQMTLLKERC